MYVGWFHHHHHHHHPFSTNHPLTHTSLIAAALPAYYTSPLQPCLRTHPTPQVYSVKDLYPGQTLDVTVLDTTSGGLVVAITQNLKGLVPKLHMSDSAGAENKKGSKFKPGKKLAARWVFLCSCA